MPQLTWEWRAKLCKIRSQVVQFSLRCSYFWPRRQQKQRQRQHHHQPNIHNRYCILHPWWSQIQHLPRIFRFTRNSRSFFLSHSFSVCLFGCFLFVILVFSLSFYLGFFYVFIVPTFKAIMSLNFLLIGLFLTLYYRKPFQTSHSVS